MDDLVRFYRDKKGEWRWQFLNGRNKKIMADSAEGYKRRCDCIDAACRVTHCADTGTTRPRGTDEFVWEIDPATLWDSFYETDEPEV